MKLYSGFCNIPRDDKVDDGGDDAWFIASSDVSAIGICDGVGSWRDKGIIAGVYARSIMRLCEKAFEEKKMKNPLKAIDYAYEGTDEEGSTTVVLAKLEADRLYYLNLGDSKLAIVREGKIVFTTIPQQHIFNVPYQLGGGNDLPMDGERGYFTVQKEDIIVAATDGLWDNLYIPELLQLLETSTNPSVLANNLATEAYKYSHDEKRWSPRAQQGYELHIYTSDSILSKLGGMPDDITVVVSKVS